MLCYCKSNKLYRDCCQPIHQGLAQATTAEALMRSRYSAFVMVDINYLMRSHHSATRPVRDKKNILAFAKSVHWLGLQIVSTKAGLEDDNEGWVEFKATYLEQGKPQCIHENSYFVKKGEQWYYKSGAHI